MIIDLIINCIGSPLHLSLSTLSRYKMIHTRKRLIISTSMCAQRIHFIPFHSKAATGKRKTKNKANCN